MLFKLDRSQNLYLFLLVLAGSMAALKLTPTHSQHCLQCIDTPQQVKPILTGILVILKIWELYRPRMVLS